MSRAEIPLKRSLSAPEPADDGVDMDESRIKGLQSELRRNKKRIRKLHTNLHGLQQENAQQKSALSLIERAWSQLQFELEQLLNTDKNETEPRTANHLLELYTGAGSTFASADPTRLAPLQLDLRVDEWATETDIENERRRLQSQQLEIDLEPLQPNLQARLGDTKQLVVELLRRTIGQGLDAGTPNRQVEEFLGARKLKTEALAYRDLTISLREQLMAAKLELVISEIRERKWNRDEATGSYADVANVNANGTHIDEQEGPAVVSEDAPLPAQKRLKTEQNIESKSEHATASDTAAFELQLLSTSSQNTELQERIDELNRRLEASQSDFRKLQIELTKTEALHAGAEQRVNQLHQENESLRHELQATGQKLNEYYAEMSTKLDQASLAAQHEVNQLKLERDSFVDQIAAARVLQETVHSLQTQVANYHEAFQSHDNQLKLALQHRDQAQQQSSSVRQQLDEALQRERALQQQLASNASVDAAVREALTQAQSGASKAEAESQNLSNQMNDLLTELDSIASDNRKLQGQNRSLIEQLGSTDQQRLLLIQEMEKMREASTAAQSQISNLERRVQALKGLLEREEAVRDNFKTHETQVLQQLAGAQDAFARLQQERYALVQHTQMLAANIEHHRLELEQANTHRGQLTDNIQQLQQEKSELQQQLKELRRRNESQQADAAAGVETQERGLDSTERQIYEKLRNMLKCSVCENRFKNTVIVRCGHLFCDQCVESSLKSRNRKCPACKERFGQDDIRRVYLS